MSITGADGCQVVGSIAIIDYTQPIDPFGYWSIYGNGTWYDLKYALPDSGYFCEWVFSDGTTMNGEDVNYAFDETDSKSVTLNVRDTAGNIVYSEEIALNPSTLVKEKEVDAVSLYPNPVKDDLHIRLNRMVNQDVQVEIYNSLGQKQISRHFTDVSVQSELSIPLTSLAKGVYFARVSGIGSSPVTLRFAK